MAFVNVADQQAKLEVIVQVGGERYRLNVQRGITAYQVMQITQLLFCLQHTSMYHVEEMFCGVFKETSEHWVEVLPEDWE